jgi:PAS domain S-box-containing protein
MQRPTQSNAVAQPYPPIMDAPRVRIMVVEDEGIVALDLVTTLKRLGYDVNGSVATGEEAIATAIRLRPDLILMDIRLAGELDGIAAAESIGKSLGVPVIFLTAHSDDDTLRRAKAVEPYSYLVKPYRAADLRCAIEVTLYRHESQVRLREQEAWLRATLNSIHDGIVTTDPEDRVRFLNPVAETLTGWTSADAYKRRLDEIVQLINVTTGIPIQLEEGLLQQDEHVLKHPQGETRAVEPSAAVIRTGQGSALGRVVVLRDVTERRAAIRQMQQLNSELERRVQARTAELENANRDLQALTYSMAHDLRAPLRAINGYSQCVIEDYSELLGEEGAMQLVRVRTATERMSDLIDGLLELARISRTECNRQTLNLSALATELTADLIAGSAGREVEVVIQPNVFATGDRHLLHVVLENLLDNAWKFTSPVSNARVEFGSQTDDGRVIYFVRDNGVGFTMNDTLQMYSAFSRLHGAQFPGNGVGLAIVERALRRMGGHIWAQSEPGHGATFFFALDDAAQ